MSQAIIDTNLDIIATIRGLGPSGCSDQCGWDASTIHAAYSVNFADNPLNLDELNSFLVSGRKKGIYKLGGHNDSDNPLYLVNGLMASQNPANAVYLSAQGLNDIRPGFLPCDTCIGQAQLNPYGIASSGIAGYGSNSGNNNISDCQGISFR